MHQHLLSSVQVLPGSFKTMPNKRHIDLRVVPCDKAVSSCSSLQAFILRNKEEEVKPAKWVKKDKMCKTQCVWGTLVLLSVQLYSPLITVVSFLTQIYTNGTASGLQITMIYALPGSHSR